MTDHVAYPGCYCTDCVEGMPHERHNDQRGYIVGNGDRTKWRAWINGMPTWVDDPAEATRYGFRSDANAVHAEDEDAWCVVKYEDVATHSARITGDKDRENPVEGAPYGEGLIGRIDTLEVKNAELRRALAYAQGEQLRLMQERHELERQLKVAREALDRVYMEDRRIVERWRQSLATGDSHLDEQIVLGRYAEIARQALANMEQADD